TTRIIPSSKQLIICFKEDGLPYPYAQLHVVQNLQDVQIAKGYHYISHWPHPTLIPRDSSRGDRFENVAYFGHYNNLVPEFRHSSWLEALAGLELKWCPIVNKNHWSKYQASNASKFEKWNDYSKVDVVLAIRSFGRSKRFVHKPATKLYNAWLAKVPAVLGHESAYYSEGKPGSNYIEAASLEEVLKALELLKDNPKMREKIVQRGWILGQNYTVEKTVDKWRLFLENIAISAFDKWCSKNRRAQLLDLRSKWISFKIRRGISRFISLDEFA
ncbi:MAG: glycosyltransferase, partial [Cyanobacteria bacterium P01_H01_bin.119]